MFLVGLCAGCGSTDEAPSTTSNTKVAGVNRDQSNSSSQSPVTAAQSESSQLSPQSNVNAAENPVPAGSTDVPPANAMEAKMRKLQLLRQGQPAPNSGPPPKPVPQPAPDNSTYTVVLAEAVNETRIFKSHPQIMKVEKVTGGNGSSIKVFLKNGRVVDLPGDRIPNLSNAPAAAIVSAISGGPDPNATTKKPSP